MESARLIFITRLGQAVLVVYGLLMLGGGIGGYVSKHSVPSLVSGVISGIVLAVAFVLSMSQPKISFGVGAATATVLAAFFVKRLMTTHKFMPSGGLLLLSLIVAVLLAYAWYSRQG